MPEPFRVFSGYDRRQVEAAEVFRFSVEQNASVEVDVRFLQLDKLPIDRRGVTDFTYSRFLVPWLCGFEGRALYGDGCDQLCLGDVAELAAWDMQGKPLWVVKHDRPQKILRHGRARSWTSLMLMDCGKLTGWGIDYVTRMSDDQLMRLRILGDADIGGLPAEWNWLVDQGYQERWNALGAAVAGVDVAGHEAAAARLEDAKLAHWSYLSDPNGGPWIDRSGSALWREWRERWLAARERDAGGVSAPRRQATDAGATDDRGTAKPAA